MNYDKNVAIRVNSEDWKQFTNKCAIYGITQSELFRRFISDIITDGKFYGSDIMLKYSLIEAIEMKLGVIKNGRTEIE